MPKFPFTNYHELNLDWILKKVTALFDASEENAQTIRTYETRLTAAEQTATSAETAATAAQQLADDAAENADSALSVAGTADSKADSALTAATNAAGAVAGALTTAQEAQQTAAAAVATANDAAATASSLESLANTANQNATAALETAQTADQKAVAAQTAATTNAGNISTLQTNVSNLNRQISDLDKNIIWVTPEMYGAVGDGETDDTAAFNAALAASPLVLLDNKPYYISGTISMSNQQKLIGKTPQTYKQQSTLLVGSSGNVTVRGTGCAIEGIAFYGKNATSDPSTFSENAIILYRNAPNFDIDISIKSCNFIGFNNTIVCYGRGLNITDCLFTYYNTAVLLNYVSSETQDIQTDKKYGSRAYIFNNNRFHTSANVVNSDSNIIFIPQTATAYGLIFTNNLCDGLCGKLNIQGGLRESLIADNVLIYPSAVHGCFLYTGNNSIISNLTINSNIFEAESLYTLISRKPESFISFNGYVYGVSITENKFSYTIYYAVVFNSYVKDGIIANNFFSYLYSDDTSDGCAIMFNSIAYNVNISNNVYDDTESYGKTNERFFVNFATPTICSYVRAKNNTALSGNKIQNGIISTINANYSAENTSYIVTQTARYGGLTIAFSGLEANTSYTFVFETVKKENIIGAYSFKNVDDALGFQLIQSVGKYSATAISSSDGNLYAKIRPVQDGTVTGTAIFDNLRLYKTSEGDVVPITIAPAELLNGTGNEIS